MHSHDLDHRRHFPNATHMSPRPQGSDGIRADPPYAEALAGLPSSSRSLVVCTGLLEHVPDPAALIGAFGRILEPGGTLFLSASGVFSYHGAPDNFFHFTPNGLHLLLDKEFEVQEMQGSTRPFETLAVLAQRINLQCEVSPPIRLLVEGLVRVLPLLDVFVLRQYDTASRELPAAPGIGIMPATIMCVSRKRLET